MEGSHLPGGGDPEGVGDGNVADPAFRPEAAAFDEVLELRLESGAWPASLSGTGPDGSDLAGVVDGLLSLRAEEWPAGVAADSGVSVAAAAFDEVLDVRLQTGQWPVALTGLDAEGADLAGLVEGLLSLRAGEWPGKEAPAAPGTAAARAFDDVLELRLRTGEWPFVLNEYDELGKLAGVVEGLLSLAPEAWPGESAPPAPEIALPAGRPLRLRLQVRRVAAVGTAAPSQRSSTRYLAMAAALIVLVGAVSVVVLASRSGSPSHGMALTTRARMSLVDAQVQLTPIAGPAGGPVAPTGVAAVVCMSAQVCVAAGASGDRAVVASSTDGGQVWREIAAPGAATSLSSISCSTTTSCLAAGAAGNSGAVVVTSDGGATWQSVALPSSTPPLSSVSCSPASCVAVGGTTGIIASADGGTSWQTEAVRGRSSGLLTAACPVDGPCLGGGSADGTGVITSPSNADRVWHVVGLTVVPGSVVPAVGPVAQLLCPSEADCAAVSVGSDGLPEALLRRVGADWTEVSLPRLPSSALRVYDIPCVQSCSTPTGWSANLPLDLLDGNAGPGAFGGEVGVIACRTSAVSTCWVLQPTPTGYVAKVLTTVTGASVST